MALRRHFKGVAPAGILVMGMLLLGSASQATAETLNFRLFNHVTRAEMLPIADVDGHFVGILVREGVQVSENGELAWLRATITQDHIKGNGTLDAYSTATFLDGSTYTAHTKGTLEATPQGVRSGSKWTGDVIHGTGRFQGIKGTISYSSKVLPAEKGEPVGKIVGEGALVYTLPGK
jgi:hypothetical protein